MSTVAPAGASLAIHVLEEGLVKRLPEEARVTAKEAAIPLLSPLFALMVLKNGSRNIPA